MKYTGTMSFEDIEKAIPMLAKRGAGFRQDVQKLITSIAVQWIASGNVAHAAKLMSRIATEIEGYYGQAIVNYAQGMFGMNWDAKLKALVYTRTTIDKAVLDQVKKEPFWEFSPPQKIKGFDFFGDLMKLLDKNQKKLADPTKLTEKDHVASLELVRGIKTLLAQVAQPEASE